VKIVLSKIIITLFLLYVVYYVAVINEKFMIVAILFVVATLSLTESVVNEKLRKVGFVWVMIFIIFFVHSVIALIIAFLLLLYVVLMLYDHYSKKIVEPVVS